MNNAPTVLITFSFFPIGLIRFDLPLSPVKAPETPYMNWCWMVVWERHLRCCCTVGAGAGRCGAGNSSNTSVHRCHRGHRQRLVRRVDFAYLHCSGRAHCRLSWPPHSSRI